MKRAMHIMQTNYTGETPTPCLGSGRVETPFRKPVSSCSRANEDEGGMGLRAHPQKVFFYLLINSAFTKSYSVPLLQLARNARGFLMRGSFESRYLVETVCCPRYSRLNLSTPAMTQLVEVNGTTVVHIASQSDLNKTDQTLLPPPAPGLHSHLLSFIRNTRIFETSC